MGLKDHLEVIKRTTILWKIHSTELFDSNSENCAKIPQAPSIPSRYANLTHSLIFQSHKNTLNGSKVQFLR